MIKLNDTTETQTIRFIPRSYTLGRSYTFKITSESENKVVFTASTTSVGSESYYHTFTDVISGLKEDNFYTLEVSDSSEVVFKDIIFVTNQFPMREIWNQVDQVFNRADFEWNITPLESDFDINKGRYKTMESTNEFIYYDA